MTTPAAKFLMRVRNATPGVVMTPASTTRIPRDFRPFASASAIHSLDSRVSWPMSTRSPSLRSARRLANAQPTISTVGRSSGYSPATPRIPSVPNSWRSAPGSFTGDSTGPHLFIFAAVRVRALLTATAGALRTFFRCTTRALTGRRFAPAVGLRILFGYDGDADFNLAFNTHH